MRPDLFQADASTRRDAFLRERIGERRRFCRCSPLVISSGDGSSCHRSACLWSERRLVLIEVLPVLQAIQLVLYLCMIYVLSSAVVTVLHNSGG
jgi:hypothetical protein